MADARCSCGALTLTLTGPPKLVVACHCLDCQRRTGAPFGVGAFYPADAVAISGTAKEFTRDAASGGKVRNCFCPNCGSTVCWRADRLPSMIGVAVGALSDPKYPSPARSIFEQSKHDWVQIGGAVDHFRESSAARACFTYIEAYPALTR
ncbi:MULTISPECIES: GFA family protein [Mesorhizobium]|uniref:Aldehyde-activating protein n=1 Tax=Rhizobium loti TaxID=381 RepID=A0A6M7U0E3_RHILI|nr:MULTISPECIES: GFA family protein [Mesorhizobium]KRB23731.1 aldehyde-activating protein [Mesorhizobium sp. Root172]OBQ67103.1 aldehyde-activating protein [Mesorhizobium loti]QKC70889.1 GFA family protein [Mesorhizobium loti]QKC89812.1 GFA family protein [Mesorhizobium sp. NZP2234]